MNPVRFAIVLFLLALASRADALDTVFTYQGFLEDGGQPANGPYDLQFRLLNSVDTQIGPIIEHLGTPVVRGVFTVPLDFGTQFTGASRSLEIAVRPGGSADPYIVLAPNTPITTVPHAQIASVAETADIASDVTDNAIDEIDINTSAVSARNIASSAVGSSELAADAVTASEIAAGAVGASEIASGAVGTAELANNAVSMAKMLGNYNENYPLSASLGAFSCVDFEVTFGGDVQANDFPLLALEAGSVLPNNMSAVALRVPSDNVVEVRICNAANVTRAFSGLQFKLLTFR